MKVRFPATREASPLLVAIETGEAVGLNNGGGACVKIHFCLLFISIMTIAHDQFEQPFFF